MIKIEIRKKIVEAREKGIKIKEISRAYVYSESAIYRLLKLKRETGKITTSTNLCGRKSTTNESALEKMKEIISMKPDITLEEIKEEMGLRISLSAISQKVRNKLGYKMKKRHSTQVRETEPTF